LRVVTTVLLIRHGRTRANSSGVLAGRMPGVQLDGVGRRQVRSVAGRLREVPIDEIVHSPLERCVQTAEGLQSARAERVPTRPDDRLLECDYGRWTGQRLAELAEDPLWRTVQEQPSAVVFPGGESMVEMAARAVAAVEGAAARHPQGVVAVVSHGDVIKAVLSAALGQPLDAFQRIAVAPGSLSVVAYGEDRPTVLRMNETGGRLRIRSSTAAPTVGGGAG
jgi:probable phosphomutase (TIGR03848 family)